MRSVLSKQSFKLEQCLERVVDNRGKTPPISESGIELLEVNAITNGQKSPAFENVRKYVSEETYATWFRSGHPRRGDTLISTVGAIGRVAFVPDERGCIAQNVVALRPKAEVLDGEFLYYLLSSTDTQSRLSCLNIGVAQPSLKVPHLLSLVIELPPLVIQRRIAGILSAYDNLIENSQRRIRILESMARNLYRETLLSEGGKAAPRRVVDCEYWRFVSENVGKYCGTKRYYATADVEGLAITGSGIEYPFPEKPSRAQKQPLPLSVWFARMKDTYKIAWYGASNSRHALGAIISSGFAGFEASEPDLWPLLFLMVSSKEFHAQKDLYCTGATQMALTNEGLGRIEMPVPEVESARRLGKKVGPMLNAMLMLQQRNEVLSRTRDLLLPRLLSGQIDVEAA